MKVCIIILLTIIISMTFWTDNIYISILDILISIFSFLFLYNLSLYIGKYLRQRQKQREREEENKKLESIFKSIERCLREQKNT